MARRFGKLNNRMKLKVLSVFLILLFLSIATPALAQDGLRGTPNPSFSPFPTEGRLKSCQARENAVKNRLSSLIRLVTNMEGKFDAIALRVENFYKNKVVPSGKTVPNYDSLVADIATQKTNVQSALTKAQNDMSSFSCTADSPKALLNQFRIDMQNVKAALKNYRTSIKNLIVAVRTVVEGGSPEPSETPEATSTPVATATPTASPTATP